MAERTIEQVFQSAVEHHRAGRFTEAQGMYQEITARDGRHAESWHHLGLLALQAGRFGEAVELIGKAAELAPRAASMQSNLGEALLAMGRLEEAVAAYGRALKLRANFPEAHSNLGNALLAAGRVEEAVVELRRAIALRENFAEAHHHLGRALKEQGKLAEAAAAYRRALALRPGHARTYNNLGVVLRGMGDAEAALDAFGKAVALDGNFAEARSNWGLALKSQGRNAEAATAFREAIALRPNFVEARYNLAEVLGETGEGTEAIAEMRSVLSLARTFPGAHHRLGNLLADAGRTEEAIAEYQHAIALSPGDGAAHLNLGVALREKRLLAEAAAAIRRALELLPDEARAHEALGETLLLMYDVAGGEACFRRSVELSPEVPAMWYAYGVALSQLGRFEEAAASFRRALAIAPDARAYQALLATGRGVGGSAAERHFAEQLQRPELGEEDRIAAEFGWGKMLDEEDRYEEAFGHFSKGNRLFKESRARAGERFDAEELRRRVDVLVGGVDRAAVAKARAWGDGSELPVFIVGMPRSGTTLVEQILASHPGVFGAGELHAMGQIAALGPPEPGAWSGRALAKGARTYMEHVRSIGGTAMRVTDKMPANVFHLGLIAAMFPGARAIICRRDARDNCLSCYFTQFEKNNLLYSYDLADCGRQYRETDRLIEHWLRALPLKILEVRYESLVAEQEKESRRLIDFAGLEWDPACLEFHRTQRPVLTASVWQVRQPMFTRSVGRWRHYERHLGPLLEAIGGG